MLVQSSDSFRLKTHEMKLMRSVCVNGLSSRFKKSLRPFLSKNYSDDGRNAASERTPPWNVLFYGTDSFSSESLEVLNADRLSGGSSTVQHLDVVTKRKITNSPLAVRQYAEKHELKVFDWPHCPAKGRYDVGIVVSFGHLIPQEIIRAFPFGMLNVHGSLLPRWRGAAPVANAILHGDAETGVSIMQISPHEFDVGKIVLQQSCPMPEDSTATTSAMTPILAKMGADLLLETLKDLHSHLEKSKEQDSSLATKAPKMKPSQAVVKWDQHTCQHIDRLYRAMHDSIQLETSWHGSRIRLLNMVHPKQMLEMDTSRRRTSPSKPGSVTYHKKMKMLRVLCADGWVGFNLVVVTGHRTMSATDFNNGFLTKVGADQQYFE